MIELIISLNIMAGEGDAPFVLFAPVSEKDVTRAIGGRNRPNNSASAVSCLSRYRPAPASRQQAWSSRGWSPTERVMATPGGAERDLLPDDGRHTAHLPLLTSKVPLSLVFLKQGS